MLLEIIPENAAIGVGIKRSQIIKLVQNHHNKLGKLQPNGSYIPLNWFEDTRSILFSKDNIDKLFIDNGLSPDNSNSAEFGLRIYLGVHDKTIIPDIPDIYENKEMVVLVITRDLGGGREDQLDDTNRFVEVAGLDFTGDGGMDHGKICPPESCGAI
jgi:hypothetical protein